MSSKSTVDFDEMSQDEMSNSSSSVSSSAASHQSTLSFHINYVASKLKPKHILLSKLEGDILPGFTAIAGSSKSGKTIFLSTLSFRLREAFMIINAHVVLETLNCSETKTQVQSVMAEDELPRDSTVYELLIASAKAKMRCKTTFEMARRVREVLYLMDIEHTETKLVGSERSQGLTLSERRRLCVALALLQNPKYLFVDFPSDGLSDLEALHFCELLRSLHCIGCSVVCTMHQTTSDVYNLFDHVIIMSQGSAVYQGTAGDALSLFKWYSVPLPRNCCDDANEGGTDCRSSCMGTSLWEDVLAKHALHNCLVPARNTVQYQPDGSVVNMRTLPTLYDHIRMLYRYAKSRKQSRHSRKNKR